MQQEAIRAFRKSWKPKPKAKESRVSRTVLALAPSPQRPAPRVSLVHPLPPPSPAAVGALCEKEARSSNTGVWRRPQRETELDALSRVVEEGKARGTPRRRLVPPPPPKSTRSKVRIEAAQRPTVAEARNAREPTDPHVQILALYAVPPLPTQDPGREAFLSVDPDWLEVIHDRSLEGEHVESGLDFEARLAPTQSRFGLRLMLASLLCCTAVLAFTSLRFQPDIRSLSRSAEGAWAAVLAFPAYLSAPIADSASVKPSNAIVQETSQVTPTATAALLEPTTMFAPTLTAAAIASEPLQSLTTASASAAPTAPPKLRHGRKRHVRTYYDVMKRNQRAQVTSTSRR